MEEEKRNNEKVNMICCRNQIFMKKIYINCSNPASTAWPATQKVSAEAYGEIVDVKFPVVPGVIHKRI